MHEIVLKAECRKAKRMAARGSSPDNPIPDGSVRPGAAPAAPPVKINETTLAAIKFMIVQCNGQLKKSPE